MAASDFTPEAKDRAIRRYLSGAPTREIAEQAGVTQRDVLHWLRQKGFRPVEPTGSPWRRLG